MFASFFKSVNKQELYELFCICFKTAAPVKSTAQHKKSFEEEALRSQSSDECMQSLW